MPTSKTVFEPIHRKVGAKIKDMRVALDWSGEELSKKVGVSRTAVHNIENGLTRVSLCDVELYAKALGTSPLDFMRYFWK